MGMEVGECLDQSPVAELLDKCLKAARTGQIDPAQRTGDEGIFDKVLES
jgi:hypothetical protein